jgi:hypothetical protein
MPMTRDGTEQADKVPLVSGRQLVNATRKANRNATSRAGVS